MKGEFADRICLGTVQFGLDYGIANRDGRVSKGEAFGILSHADTYGINTVDTGYLYGKSEETIGEFGSRKHKTFRIISKTPRFDKIPVSDTKKYLRRTLKRVGQERIYGYLVHSFSDIRTYRKKLWREMESLKKEGYVEKIGVSLYKPEELEFLFKNNYRPDIVQVPYSIFDQRFKDYFSLMKERDIEVYTRSAFLQGLFFMSLNDIAKEFQSVTSTIVELNAISLEYDIPIYALCLGFVILNNNIDKVIIGVDSLDQLMKNLRYLVAVNKIKLIYRLLESLRVDDENVILPYKWKREKVRSENRRHYTG